MRIFNFHICQTISQAQHVKCLSPYEVHDIHLIKIKT